MFTYNGTEWKRLQTFPDGDILAVSGYGEKRIFDKQDLKEVVWE